MLGNAITEELHRVMAEDAKSRPQGPREVITLVKVLEKNKGYLLRVHSTGKEISRKLSDIYWLQTTLMTEFPYYYVA